MIRALYTAATGMDAQETNIDVISNNLANVNTTGFKKSRAEFQDLIYQYLVEPGATTGANTSSPSGVQVGLGVKTAAVQKVFEQGDLQSTGRDLDLAIEGDGFIGVTLPNGEIAYTRSGSFQLDAQGNLVTPDGYQLQSGISIPPNALSISIAENGEVFARLPNQPAAASQGIIDAVRFPNNAGLRALGRNLYQETGSSGAPATGEFNDQEFGRIAQGFLETSNVSVVEQVVNMITAQRAYEASSRGIQTADDMMNQAINLKR